MGIPEKKRVNTIGIRYIKGEREDSHYRAIIVDILGVSEDEIGGICEMGPKVYVKGHICRSLSKVMQEFCAWRICI